jgi:hypothetical protein
VMIIAVTLTRYVQVATFSQFAIPIVHSLI